ncbi:hypothetical protein prwr041_11560 [Prevotella herbatica]|uniref:DUF4252 domain-containing protein n=1 Tax=Prevotella herbatica TaxID=2801997 RepID=A0ABM7NXS6_9BACT|nr:hypothetical protein [Prevotella herbatica]BCS85263.1 hypothetical protein prwr041_11560 [Prevotella herbatica]
MKKHLIKFLLLALFILPTVCQAQQQVDSNQINVRLFYCKYAPICQLPNFDDFYKQYTALLDEYASSSFKQSVLSELDDSNSPGADIATDDHGIQKLSLDNLKVEKRGAYYLVSYPIYDSDEKKYIEIGLDVTLDYHGKIQSISGSYTKEINNPNDLDKQQ